MIRKKAKTCLFVLAASLLVLAAGSPVLAANQVVVNTGSEQGKEKVPSRVPKITSKVRIDGVIDDQAWQEALVLTLDYEISPGYNIKPPVKTELFLAYSDSHLFVAFKAFDPDPSQIRARYTDRDKFQGDDWVAILMDTFNDSRRTFNLCCNPYGIQTDVIQSVAGGNDMWDAIWDSAGKIYDWGYAVEIAIPFSSLRFQKTEADQVWGIDAMRGYPRSAAYVFSLIPHYRNDNCVMCRAEKLVGFKGVNQGKNLEFDPTLSAIYNQERPIYTKDEFETKEKKVDPGITFRWSMSPNMTLNATLNPDFSNVEADAALLDINTQFALYYPEKRPFFLEGFSIFNTRLLAVNTRAFADPDWGLKLSGKSGKSAVGLFTAQDSVTNLVFPGSQGSRSTSLGMDTFGTVARYRLDISRSSNLGFLVTDREGDDYFNRLAGIDLDLRVTPRDRIAVQFLGSQTRYPDDISSRYQQPQEDFWGTALDIFYYHNTKHLDWYLLYKDIGAEFRADLGFIPKTDYRYYDSAVQYAWLRRAGSWFTQINLGGGYIYETDHDHNLLQKRVRLWLEYYGPMQSFLQMTGFIGKRSFLGIEFDYNRLEFDTGFQSGRFVFGIKGVVGDEIDFWNVRQGKVIGLNPTLEIKTGKHITSQLDHVYEQLKVDAGRLYTANITNLKVIYHFNRRTFLRAILQYVNNELNPDLYLFPMDSRRRQVFSQFLFSYKINPQTVLFLGYSDNYDGNQEFALTQDNRTIFLKIGYALVL